MGDKYICQAKDCSNIAVVRLEDLGSAKPESYPVRVDLCHKHFKSSMINFYNLMPSVTGPIKEFMGKFTNRNLLMAFNK